MPVPQVKNLKMISGMLFLSFLILANIYKIRLTLSQSGECTGALNERQQECLRQAAPLLETVTAQLGKIEKGLRQLKWEQIPIINDILNSLQMGFRTLAIQKSSSEVWQILSSVKNNLPNFEDCWIRHKKYTNRAEPI